MKQNDPFDFLKNYETHYKLPDINARYFPPEKLNPIFSFFGSSADIVEIGKSSEGRSIFRIDLGRGPIKILAWSQMHGNESTSTRALLDFIQFLSSDKKFTELFHVVAIPILNPDGAAAYTRSNANHVDLNRDARELKEKESLLIRNCFEDFKPDVALNLHDQRTIFSAGQKSFPATLSFLAPAVDPDRTVPSNRLLAMQLIAGINKDLQAVIPNQVGRFDDTFNPNCIGDSFQSLGVPTLLIEAGHYQEDYLREETRKYFCFSLFKLLDLLSNKEYLNFSKEDYEDIPENRKNFLDVILRKGRLGNQLVDIGIQFEEILKENKICFRGRIQEISDRIDLYGHQEISCEGGQVSGIGGADLSENDIVEAILLNEKKISIKTPNTP